MYTIDVESFCILGLAVRPNSREAVDSCSRLIDSSKCSVENKLNIIFMLLYYTVYTNYIYYFACDSQKNE